MTTIAGLSPAMCTVLQAVGHQQVRESMSWPYPSRIGRKDVTRTVDALLHRGLITRGERDRRWATWELTDAGRALLDRLDGAT
jgi:hypothetical protein